MYILALPPLPGESEEFVGNKTKMIDRAMKHHFQCLGLDLLKRKVDVVGIFSVL